MGGGDLNLKKSWHPATLRNQERVWKEEQKALEEQKKLDQLKKELDEERQLQELQRLQESSGARKRSEKLDWMYAAGPTQSSATQNDDLEAFLLGKKRVDSLIEQGTKVSELSQDSSSVFVNTINVNANTYRDTQAKVREDPLLAIRRREQESLKMIMNNPLKMKQYEKQLSKKKDKKKSKKSKRDKEKKRRHSDSDNEEKANSRSKERKHHRRASPRSISPRRGRNESRDRSSSPHRGRKQSPRRNQRSPPRSISPRRGRNESRDRSLSPRRGRNASRDRSLSPRRGRNASRDRSPSPRRGRNGNRNRSPSPRRSRHDNRDRSKSPNDRSLRSKHANGRNRSQSRSPDRVEKTHRFRREPSPLSPRESRGEQQPTRYVRGRSRSRSPNHRKIQAITLHLDLTNLVTMRVRPDRNLVHPVHSVSRKTAMADEAVTLDMSIVELEKQRRLREMAEAAQSLDQERKQRVEEINRQEAEEALREQQARMSRGDASKARFLNEAHKAAYFNSIDLGERTRRNRAQFQRRDAEM
ncbi:hypothetical protein K493DRAFT_311432 [Basidiobolus meristosporus CBS 931.73]|uniref:CBF1-interacting co-repressor CIR N-terminal domain-containing protein n=1 Tax=Basidiobolus meristosporus CBS 931.73 TaxID=1314790 RepID=A0A1Y1Z207_9FUNG|nr:hypothetical protein K493DRAFT_311432 [Basidiobolus meristosporus CBS 931.73]|eukprot:ORY04206.1 hypothetical protein K493DRAFT_311432 [Basidiobolus meristosporus CBS 931.73]